MLFKQRPDCGFVHREREIANIHFRHVKNTCYRKKLSAGHVMPNLTLSGYASHLDRRNLLCGLWPRRRRSGAVTRNGPSRNSRAGKYITAYSRLIRIHIARSYEWADAVG
jgi:hypothetical protein